MISNYYKTNMDKIKDSISKIANERSKKSANDTATYPKAITQEEYEQKYDEPMLNVCVNPKISQGFYINRDFYEISHHNRQYAKYSKRINFNNYPEIYDNIHLASVSSFVFRDDDTPYYDDYIKINFSSPNTTIDEFKNDLLKNKFDWTFIPYIVNPKLYKYNDPEKMTLSTAHVRGPNIKLAKDIIGEINWYIFNKTGERMFYNVYDE